MSLYITPRRSVSVSTVFHGENGRLRARYLDSVRQTGLERCSAGFRRRIYRTIGGVPLSLHVTVLARCRRRQRSMIRRSTASTDARIASAGPFYPGVQLGSTSMVHLRPILAMLRSFGLPCFYVGGCGGCGQLLTFASHARACFYRVMLSFHTMMVSLSCCVFGAFFF